jgi:hypothetical protein
MVKRYLSQIVRYLHQTEKYSTFRFIFEVALVGLMLSFLCGVVSMVILALIGALIPAAKPLIDILTYVRDFDDLSSNELFTLSVLFAPLVETFIGQALPLWIISRFTKKLRLLLIISALFFAALHKYPVAVIAIFPTAITLSWSWIVYRKRSFLHAYLVTSAIHALHNLVVYALVR